MIKVLLVEDEPAYAEPLTYQLEREGFEVVATDDGQQALTLFQGQDFDLVLLDLMLPGLPGTEICRQIRLTSQIPVIMLTAKDTEIDKVVGLEIGADDYVTKPYSFRELLARIRAVLRRGSSPDDLEEDEVLKANGITLDIERHIVSINGEQVSFPLKEFELLKVLMRNPGRVLTRDQLIDRVWGSDYVGDTKTLDVHVKRVRQKIEDDPSNPQKLVTVRGLGYKLTAG